MKIEHGSPARQQKGSLRDTLYVVFSHKTKMLTFMLLLFGVVAIKSLLDSGKYRSEARLLVRLGRETISLDPTATIGEIAQINRTYDWEVNSELEILKSREIAERVVDRMGAAVFLDDPNRVRSSDETPTAAARLTSEVLDVLDDTIDRVKEAPRSLARRLGLTQPLTDRDKAVEEIIENIEIKTLQNTNVISLACDQKDPELARDILDVFIQTYLEKHLTVYSTSNSQQFFEQQVASLQDKLRQTEREMQSLKDDTGISSLDEQRLAAVNKIGTMELTMSQAEGELASSLAKVADLEKVLSGIPETLVTEEVTGFSDYAADLMRSRLYDLQLQQRDLEVKYPNGSRMLEMVREQVREGLAMLEKEKDKPNRTETRTGVNTSRQQIQIELFREQANVSAMRSKIETVRQQVADAKDSLRSLNDAEIKTARLQRDIALLNDSYGRYSTKLQEARIEQALKGEKISNISIVQAATLPVVPVGPGKLVRLALGLVLALIGGVGFAFFCEYMDHSIKTPEDVQEKLQLPTLASIPRTRQNRVQPVGVPPRLARLVRRTRPKTPVQWDLPSPVRRHYVAFRERLLLAANGVSHGHYVIGVMSCSRCEGVSTVAANLASSLSEMADGGVLLVDANPHDPSIHRIFQTGLSPGLLDVLIPGQTDDGDGKIIHQAAGLNFVTAGGADHPSAKPPNLERLIRFLQLAKEDYRFIVVDMPALDEDGSVVRLAGSCDGLVLVVETERLRWEAVSKARQQLEQWNTNVLGVLLNKRRFPVPSWVYAVL
ncbi:MAG: GumC family protein [Solirubrobacterales bacterium]